MTRLSKKKLLELIEKNPALRISPEELEKIKNMPAESKYKNTFTSVDGIKFHSQAEAKRYGELKILKQSGEIMDFKRQVPYKLGGKVNYVIDFEIKHNDGRVEVEEVKGFWTAAAKIKVRLFRERYTEIKLTVIGADDIA